MKGAGPDENVLLAGATGYLGNCTLRDYFDSLR